jgi:hypothetical protein
MTKKQKFRILGLLIVSMAGSAMGAQSEARGPQTAREWINLARGAMGMDQIGDRVIHARVARATEQSYQSDRYYPPFFSMIGSFEEWFDPASGVERLKGQAIFPGTDPFPIEILGDARRSYSIRKEKAVLQPRSELQARYLNPWAVLHDWSSDDEISVRGKELYRDYPRIVLGRKTPDGEQRLFLDLKTGFPVKLDFEESHYLWGQRHIEYVYSNWVRQQDIFISGSSFCLADGEIEVSQTVGSAEVSKRTDADSTLNMPPEPEHPVDALPGFLQAKPPKAMPVSPTTYLLSNPGYTEAVTLANGEIFIFDTTQSEERARLDSEAIRNLFPGQHKVNVVVTDLAWPHVAGVRYWVAHGATIISHSAAKPFLQRIIKRRWTRNPDELERHRNAKLRFIPIDSATQVAGGKVTIVPIDGIGSEIALACFVANDRFLWASDYIQDTSEPTAYASDVWNAVQRAHLEPKQVAAEHVGLTDWARIAALQR